MKVRFDEWRAEETPIMESELPPGTRYTWDHILPAEFVAAQDGRRTCVVQLSGMPCHWHFCGPRSSRQPVTILDWPSWSGPRPNTKTERPKLSEAVKMVCHGDVVAVVAHCHAATVQTFDAADIARYGDFSSADPYYTVLGFLIAEESK